MTSTAKETSVQVAVVQAGAVPFDTEACVDKGVRLIGEAAPLGQSGPVPGGTIADIQRTQLRSSGDRAIRRT
jgi:hypothetical protein